jgi:protein ImuB
MESDRLELLLPFIAAMLDKLTALLRAQDAAVDLLWLLFRHAYHPPTRFRIGSVTAHRDSRQWQLLIDTQLQNKSFPAPVIEIQLISGQSRPYQAMNHSLLSDDRDLAHETLKLITLLQARLGSAAVHGLAAVADARPECAWETTMPGKAKAKLRPPGNRPLLLLPMPKPLDSSEGLPWYRGVALQLIPSPERIAGAWWEGESWQRDYYRAQSRDGARLWIYRCGVDWFLHGFFS